MRRAWTVLAAAAALLAAAPAAALADPPPVSITGGPSGPTNNASPTFTFGTDDALAVLTCRLDGPAPLAEQPCASPLQLGPLPDGDYTFVVHATDPATGVGEATRAFTVDTHAPAAPGLTAPADGATVRGPDVTVSGTAEAGAAVDVSDGGVVVARATAGGGTWSTTARLEPDGPHTLTAVATDAAGNASPPSDAAHLTVDSVAPDTTIESGPSGLTNQASAAFGLSASEAGATFQCRLAGPGHEADAFGACAGYSGLPDGAYTFAARAVDTAGNLDDTPATRTFTVDTTPPAAPALSGTPAEFVFASEPGATFACALDGPFQACSSPLTLSGLAPGRYTLRVHALDAAGNQGADAALAFTVAAPLPAPLLPVFHAAVVARPGLANVRIRLPGSGRYTRLAGDRAVPLGTVFDTRRGSVQIVSAPRRGAAPQRASFDGGVFRVTQPGRTTVLTLVGSCRPAHGLTGDGRGAFEVRGRYSSATVRSARWVVRDSCAGTLTRALRGVVQVRDRVRRRTVLVRAGRRYLARPHR